MNEENQVTPKPPIKTAKVAEYLIDLYDQNGYVLEENKAFEIAGSEDLKSEITRQYRVLGVTAPEQKDLDSIYNSFIDIEESEKKNLLQNTATVLESSSVLEENEFSSEPDPTNPKSDPVEEPLGVHKLFSDSMNRIGMDIFSMNGENASAALEQELGVYGFKFRSTANGSKISVETPDGDVNEFRLFTEKYRGKPGLPEDVNKLAEIRLDELKSYLASKSDNFLVDHMSALVNNATEGSLINVLSDIVGKYDQEVLYDMDDAISRIKRRYNINQFLVDGKPDRGRMTKAYDEVQQTVISKSDKFSVTTKRKLESAIEKFNINKSNIASILSGVLSKTGAYKKIDITNQEQIDELSRIGLSPADIPIDVIKVNGVARSINYLTSNILYDYEKVQDIRDGKLNIEIGDPKAAGVLAPYVQRVKKIADNQNAFRSKSAGKPVLRFIEEIGEIGEDTLQSIGISILEIPTNMAYITYDTMKAMGVSDEKADLIAYGSTGLMPGRALRPYQIENLRNEYLPQWDGSYLDSSGFMETIARGSQDFANSTVTSALFMIPGGQGIALANVGASSYAQDRIEFEKLRRSVDDKRRQGYILTEEELNIINMSDSKARLSSLSKAAIETATTKVFTGNFFKKYGKFAGVKTKIEGQYGSIANFNRTYAKAVRDDVIGLVNRYTGLSIRAIGSELPEENIIALTSYASDITFGRKKFDFTEAKDLWLNTNISTIFTSAGMGKMASLSTNRRARRLAVDLVANNITLPQETSIKAQKMIADAQLAERESQLELEGMDATKDPLLDLLRQNSLNLADKVNRIDAEKRKIAEQMPAAEKVEFFEIMQAIQQTKKGMENVEDLGQQKAILEQINSLRDKGRKLLDKYPSELSYHFADQATQDKFESRAIQELSDEAKKNGKDFDLKSGDDIVVEKAASLYSEYLKSEQDAELDKYNAFSAFGNVQMPQIKRSSEDIERDSKEINELMSMLSTLNDPDHSIDDLLVDELNKDVKIREILKSQLNLEDTTEQAFEELSKKLADENLTDEEKEALMSEMEGLEMNYFELSEILEDEKAKSKGNAFAGAVNRLFEGRGGDRGRVDAIYSRLKALDVAASDLSEIERQTLLNLKRDLEKNRMPQLGKIEAMLDAMEAVNQIFAKSGGKISLDGMVDEDGTLTEKAVNSLNDLAKNFFIKGKYGSGSLATKDILARTLFRDREVGAPFIDNMNEAFRLAAEGEQKADKAKQDHLSQYKKDGGTDPNQIENSYEMFLLGALRRRTETVTPDGKDAEFSRMQGLIADELNKRKAEHEADPKDKVSEMLYKYFKDAVDKLGVLDAKEYSEVAAKADKANVNAIDRLASVMPGQRAIDRINDFESYGAFEYQEGSYIPLFMKNGTEGYTDYSGPSTSGTETIAGSLKDVTRPNSLQGDLRLNPEMFWDNAYRSYRGMEVDITSRKAFETFNYIVNSSKFQNMIEGKAKKEIIESFKNVKKGFETEIRRSESKVLDVKDLQNVWKSENGKKLLNAIYGSASGVALARYSQRANQFYSAVTGASVYLKNGRAKSYLGKKTLKFTVGFGKMSDGGSRRKVLGDNMKQLIGTKDAKLGNIYAKSRTGLRNSVLANVAVDGNQKIPLSYYASSFNLDPTQVESMEKALGTTATVDAVLDFIIKSNEINLNFWLGSADRLAANATFEAAYLDYKLSNGSKVGEDLDAWWAEENNNPDLAAIRYADEVVAKTQRQTGAYSEADVYSTSSQKTKTAMRVLFPFGKFVMNAKSDISNNISILLDPNVPQSQKRLAEAVIRGRGAEVLTYNALKVAAGNLMVKGVMSLFGFGTDEEDIPTFDGMSGLISEKLLPIVSKEDFNPSEMGLDQATTWEEYNAILDFQAGIVEVDGIAKEFKTYSETFEDKFKTSGDYSLLASTAQDFVMTMNPFAVPDIAEDMFATTFNKLYGEDLFTEFLSSDFDKLKTLPGTLSFISEKSGMSSIGIQQAAGLQKAYNMAANMKVYKFAEFGTVEENIYAPTDAMREKVIGATQLLVALRMYSAVAPIGPRADIDKLADKLERAIEDRFTRGKVDDRINEMKSNYSFPFGVNEDELGTPKTIEDPKPEKKPMDSGGFGFDEDSFDTKKN